MRKVGPNYIAANAIVVGDVVLHPGANIWYGCVLRGDVARLTLGPNANLQDGVIMHADTGYPNEIEAGGVVGHGAILHGIRVGRDSLIGMGATLLSRSDIGPECIIAAGSLVPEGMIIPPRSVVMGVPGKIVRQVRDDEVEKTRAWNKRYLQLAEDHAAGKYRAV
jgi:carbonic anhydrase/acetyltransferase-like protein (isoleucine patch superfamily)